MRANPGTVQQCLTDLWPICGSELEDPECGRSGGGMSSGGTINIC